MKAISVIVFITFLLGSCNSGKRYFKYRSGGHSERKVEKEIAFEPEPTQKQFLEPMENSDVAYDFEKMNSSENENQPLLKMNEALSEKKEAASYEIAVTEATNEESKDPLFTPVQKSLLAIGVIIAVSEILATLLSVSVLIGFLITIGSIVAAAFILILLSGCYII